jgi:cysteine desulfurase/selenocysteine lyase
MTLTGAQPSLRDAPDWASVRADYQPALRRAYLDTACKGIPSSSAVAAVATHCEFLRECPGASTTADTLVALEQFDRARHAAAVLINADPTELALVPSTQAGLNAICDALDLKRGDVVLASDMEFVGTVLPWELLASRGVELRLVPHRGGRLEIADFEPAVDARTRVIVISSVQEVNGYRVDLDAFAAFCRDRNIVSVVDGVQHVGPLRIDVRATPIDVLAVGGHKWLCAPFGMGFLYVARWLHESLRPSTQGYMTARPPSGEWLDYLENPDRLPTDPLRFATDARMLELGAIGSSLAAAGLAGALETLLAIGPDLIAARTEQLVKATAAALEEAGATVHTPAQDGQTPAFLCFRTGDDIDDERRTVERLAEAGVLTSLRFTTGLGGIRVSPYFYNDESDLDRLVSVVRGSCRRARVR